LRLGLLSHAVATKLRMSHGRLGRAEWRTADTDWDKSA
jgi:hypothetical protein